MGWLWWIGAALAFGILEMLSLDLVLAMFAGGAIAGAIAYWLGASVPGGMACAAPRSACHGSTAPPRSSCPCPAPDPGVT